MNIWQIFLKEKFKMAAVLLLVLSFWSIFYPELTLTGDSYRKVEGDGVRDIRGDYYEILNAEEGEVEIRFSFLERKKDAGRE